MYIHSLIPSFITVDTELHNKEERWEGQCYWYVDYEQYYVYRLQVECPVYDATELNTPTTGSNAIEHFDPDYDVPFLGGKSTDVPPSDDQPEYTAVSHSHPPDLTKQPSPLVYNTVVRQDGMKVSVKINIPAPSDQTWRWRKETVAWASNTSVPIQVDDKK